MAGDPDVDMNQPLRALLGDTGAGRDKNDGKVRERERESLVSTVMFHAYVVHFALVWRRSVGTCVNLAYYVRFLAPCDLSIFVSTTESLRSYVYKPSGRPPPHPPLNFT